MRPSKITELRERMGLNKKEFAKLFGVSSSTIVEWERNRSRPKPHNLEKLLEVWDKNPPLNVITP